MSAEESWETKWQRRQEAAEKRRRQTEHRKVPLFDVPPGRCRWCGEPTEPRLKKDGTLHAQQLSWHPACVLDHGIAANSTTAYGAVADRDGERCCDCGAAPNYEPGSGPSSVSLEVDHDMPLWRVRDLPHLERREYFRLPNLKLRCVACHKAKSAREAAERAAGPTEETDMAKKLKPDDDGRATKDHNVAEIKQTIREVASEVICLKAEKAEIQEQITEAKSRLKAKGIKMADFNAALRLYELEAEDRNESIDNLRLVFEALEIGGQGDLFPPQAEAGEAAALH